MFIFITDILWQTFWRNNWRSVFDNVKRLRFSHLEPFIQKVCNWSTFVHCVMCNWRLKATVNKCVLGISLAPYPSLSDVIYVNGSYLAPKNSLDSCRVLQINSIYFINWLHAFKFEMVSQGRRKVWKPGKLISKTNFESLHLNQKSNGNVFVILP